MTQDLFDRATNAATCDFLSTTGSGAAAYAAWGLLTPGPFDEFGAIAYAGLAKVAYDLGCTWDPEGEAPPGQFDGDGCQKVTGGVGNMEFQRPGQGLDWQLINTSEQAQDAVEILSQERRYFNKTEWRLVFTYQTATFGEIKEENIIGSDDFPAYLRINPQGAAVCGDEEPPYVPPNYVYDYTDPETGCSLTVSMEGYSVDPGNRVSPVWLLTKSDQLRASGGIISGDCNFAPTVVVPNPNGPGGGGGGEGGGGGGGTTYLPVPPDTGPGPDGGPWWQSVLGGLAGGAVAGLIDAAIGAALSRVYPGLIYRMVSVCEKDASGEPISEAVEVPIPNLPAPDAQLARLDAIVELLQASKNFKQPICNDRPKLQGNWRTISFRSTQSSPYGKSCLRKRFRYRSVSGIGLGELVDHWKDFTWTSGPVCVTHKGYSWGTPQVWAATADEGKRVIQHAAREAGFDANQVGEWGISNSSSPRYGVSLPMKVDTTGGYYWVTERDGSDGRPIVAL